MKNRSVLTATFDQDDMPTSQAELRIVLERDRQHWWVKLARIFWRRPHRPRNAGS
jgi:hypothetical protein